MEANKDIRLGDKVFTIAISSSTIQKRIDKLAGEISDDYAGKCPVILGVMNGVYRFAADLTSRFDFDCVVDFVKLSSYEGTETSGEVKTQTGLREDITGRDVIILEDIVDTGTTISHLVPILADFNPKTLKIATLLFKPTAYRAALKADYVAFEIPDDFVVGYGLDYDGLGRNLNSIYQLKLQYD